MEKEDIVAVLLGLGSVIIKMDIKVFILLPKDILKRVIIFRFGSMAKQLN